MRIALDATYSTGPHLTGIGIYSQRLLHGLASAYPEDDFLFCYRPSSSGTLQFLAPAMSAAGFFNRRCLFSARICFTASISEWTAAPPLDASFPHSTTCL